MGFSNDKFFRIYEILFNHFLSGSLALIVAETIYEDKSYEKNLLIQTILVSTSNTAILSIANIIKENKDSVSLKYLTNCLKDSKDFFDHPTKIRFNDFVKEVDLSLKTIKDVLTQIEDVRDNTIAHIDRVHVNNQDFLLTNGFIKWVELKKAYFLIENILFEISTYLNFDIKKDMIEISKLDLKKKTIYLLNKLE